MIYRLITFLCLSRAPFSSQALTLHPKFRDSSFEYSQLAELRKLNFPYSLEDSSEEMKLTDEILTNRLKPLLESLVNVHGKLYGAKRQAAADMLDDLNDGDVEDLSFEDDLDLELLNLALGPELTRSGK